MKKKFNLLFITLFISFLCSNGSIAKPRCEELHEKIYNDDLRQDVNFYYQQGKKTIGIRLLKIPDENKKILLLHKTKMGILK